MKIINLDIVFYGFKALFNMYKENKYKGINIDNNEEFITEYEKHISKNNDFDYESLENDSKIIYDMLKSIKNTEK